MNYPMKYVLVRMDNDGIIDMGNYVQGFCVSYVTGKVAKAGFERVAGAWNQHRIPDCYYVIYLCFFLTVLFKE